MSQSVALFEKESGLLVDRWSSNSDPALCGDRVRPLVLYLVMNLSIYVDNDGSLSLSWMNLQSKFGRIQKHLLRGSQEFVRYHPEVDIGT